eukprot:gene16489-45826_t
MGCVGMKKFMTLSSTMTFAFALDPWRAPPPARPRAPRKGRGAGEEGGGAAPDDDEG